MVIEVSRANTKWVDIKTNNFQFFSWYYRIVIITVYIFSIYIYLAFYSSVIPPYSSLHDVLIHKNPIHSKLKKTYTDTQPFCLIITAIFFKKYAQFNDAAVKFCKCQGETEVKHRVNCI